MKAGLVERVGCVAILVVLFGAAVSAVPVADGRYDPAEGYTNSHSIALNVEGLEKGDPLIPAPDPGQLWIYQDPTTLDVSVVFIQPVTLVDNTYGANSIGWGGDAPSGKSHNFGDLKGSDKAQFTFTDGLGNVVLDVTMDYIDEDGGVYSSGGVIDGDGDVHTGSAADVKAWGSSLDYSFNVLGHNTFTEDSPLSVPDYSDPPSAPGWIFEVIYEVQVDGALFAANGFGGVTIPIVHDSPNKIGKNKVYTEELGGLQIIKFEDENANAELDDLEALLAGWQFQVDGPGGFSELVTTGPNGMAVLSDLELGEYTIGELLKDGWELTTPNPLTVDVLENQTATVYFGNVQDGDKPIAEPATGALLLVGLIAARRRRRK